MTAKHGHRRVVSSNAESSGTDKDEPRASETSKSKRSRRRRAKLISSSSSSDDCDAKIRRTEAASGANGRNRRRDRSGEGAAERDAQQRDAAAPDELPFSRKEEERIVRYIVKFGHQKEIEGLALWKLIK